MSGWCGGGAGRRALAALALVALLAGACAESGSSEITLPPTASTEPLARPERQETTTTTAADDPGDGVAEAVRVWSEMIVAGAERAESDRNDELIATLATPEVDQLLTGLFVGEFAREALPHPVVVDDGGGVVRIEDCVILRPGITETPTVWFSGTVEVGSDGRAVVTELVTENFLGCVPETMAEVVLADYEAFWDSRDAYYNPPNPTAPELDATVTGSMLEISRDLAQRLLDDGQFLQGRPTTHPEIVAVTSATEVTVADCQITNPDRGIYDTASGQRTDLIPTISPGQLDGMQITMVLEGGAWKVRDFQAANDITCEFAPTPLGLPIVPQPEVNP